MRKTLPIVAALLIALSGLAYAQSSHHGTTKTGAKDTAATKAYKAANEKMHKGMDIRFSNDPDVDFIRGMIPHHYGAIDMAKVVLQYGKNEQTKKWAQDIIREPAIHEPSLSEQRAFWNQWNDDNRRDVRFEVSLDQAKLILSWLEELGPRRLEILEVGCGTGWLCEKLAAYGNVTGTGLSDEMLARAAVRLPHVRFVPGDFATLDFGESYDVAVSLEVLAHVADQGALLRKIAASLKPGGYLMLATQNKNALQRSAIPPPAPGQLRNWVDRHHLRRLLEPDFEIVRMCSITPRFNRGLLRFINSEKLTDFANAVHLSFLPAQVRSIQERAWLGWSLMVLARKRDAAKNPTDPTLSLQQLTRHPQKDF